MASKSAILAVKILVDQAKAAADVDSMGAKFGSVFSGVGKAAGAGLAAAGVAVGVLATKVVKSFGELQQNLGGAEAVFGSYADTIKARGVEAYRTLGITQSEYLSTANKMGSLFQGSGITQRESLDLTSKAMQRAADVASVMGIDTSMAMESIAGAAKGNFTMMDNLGVAMNATTIQAYALEKGVNFNWNTASNAEKTQLAMQMFFERTSQYAGNFEREATSTITGSFGLMQAAWGSLVAGLGDANGNVGQLTTNLINAFGSVVKNVGPVLQTLATNIPGVLSSLVGQIGAIVPQVLTLGAALINGLLSGIVAAAPGLVNAAVPIVMTLIQSLLGQIPAILNAALQIIVALSNGITAALPTLLPVVARVLVQIVDTLIANLPMLLTAALALIQALAQGLIAALPTLMAALPRIITSLVAFFNTAMPQILNAGIALFTAIVNAIPRFLPQLLAMLPRIITTLIGFLTKSIPMLITAGITMLNALVQAIPKIIPPLVAALPKIINALVTGLTKAIPQLIAGAVQLLLAIVQAIPKIVGPILAALPQIGGALTNGLIRMIPSLVSAGAQLLGGLIKGLMSAIGGIGSVVAQIGKGLIGGVKSLFGIKSPSRVMAGLGQNILIGLTRGIEDQMRPLANTMNRVSDTITGGINPGGGALLNQAVTVTGGGNLNTAAGGITPEALAGALNGMSMTLVIDGQPVRGIVRTELAAQTNLRRLATRRA